MKNDLLLKFVAWMATTVGKDALQEVIESETLKANAYLQEENRVLREHIRNKFGCKRICLNDSQRRRLAARGAELNRYLLSKVTNLFSPATILAWHRKLIAQKYDGGPNQKGGRPKISQEIIDLVIRLATENRSWSHRRIRNYVVYLGHTVSNSTVQRIMEDFGLEPGGKDRKGKTTWNEFIRSHMNVLAACDFFSVELLTKRGLVRVMVLFVIDLATRKVKILGIKSNPDGQWMKQMARNLTNWDNGILEGKRYLIHDRDSLFTQDFKEILKDSGVTTVVTQPKSPNMNPFSEVWVRIAKNELIDKMIFTSEDQLRYALSEFIKFYHHYRPHLGLGGKMIDPLPQDPDGEIQKVEFLGGLLRGYRRVKIAA